jgi:DNA-binding transcriptional ArsR family regulator
MTASIEFKRNASLEVAIEWAPAYELLVSFACFISRRLHPILDLGPEWARDVRMRLPAGYLAGINQRGPSAIFESKCGDDLLLLLARACEGSREAGPFLDWFGELSTGVAYELLAPRLPDDGSVVLPRDFAAWRDRVHDALEVWNEAYFVHLDPAILSGLEHEAEERAAAVAAYPAQEFIEQVTNGIWIEPGSTSRKVTLIPQYHERPYNHDTLEHEGPLILYPADVLPPAPGAMPVSLLRLMRGLGDESRLRILRFVVDGPCTLTEIARSMGLSQPTVHHHLVQLRAAGLVRVHHTPSTPSRYSLRPRAVELVAEQLGAYLLPGKGVHA